MENLDGLLQSAVHAFQGAFMGFSEGFPALGAAEPLKTSSVLPKAPTLGSADVAGHGCFLLQIRSQRPDNGTGESVRLRKRWLRTFPADFYRELFRLRGLPYNGAVKRPQYIGHLTNDLVYARLAPGVLEELRRIRPRDEKGRLKHHLHRRLTEDLGHPKLLQHLFAVTALMRASGSWDQFKLMVDRALPRQLSLPLFDGWEQEGEGQLLPSPTPTGLQLSSPEGIIP
jgi:hypothetical protein